MAQLSGFWTTGGTVGHQVASYTQAHWSSAGSIFAACTGYEGVAPGMGSELAVTSPNPGTVVVWPGAAMVDGKWYYNSAPATIAIATAIGGGNTRVDRIVLCCNWATSAYSATIRVLGGTNAASPGTPAYGTASGSDYDIPLYRSLINTGGTITLTDERIYASRAISNRQGGSANNWSTGGNNNYVPLTTRIQSGALLFAIAGGDSSSFTTVTFPAAFQSVPLIFMNLACALPADGYQYVVWASNQTAADFQLNLRRSGSSGATNITVDWFAIGI